MYIEKKGVINVHVEPKDKESNELENALKETISIEKEYKEDKRKGYNNANEMMRSILDD